MIKQTKCCSCKLYTNAINKNICGGSMDASKTCLNGLAVFKGHVSCGEGI